MGRKTDLILYKKHKFLLKKLPDATNHDHNPLPACTLSNPNAEKKKIKIANCAFNWKNWIQTTVTSSSLKTVSNAQQPGVWNLSSQKKKIEILNYV